MKAFVIDISICNGCYCCQIACKDEHVGNDWTPYAKPQPDTGQFWLKQNEFVRGTVPKVKMNYLPVLCMHCDEAPCIPACPSGAIYKRDDGLVIIDPVKCTGCAHLLDGGHAIDVPRCVDACPTEALKCGEESELKALISKAEVLHPEFKAKPRVYYLNIPKKFVAGTVYDPVAKEVIIGATCTLSGNGSKKLTATTDGFGDFWLEGLEVGTYSLKIESKGFAAKTMDSISTEKDVNLGDIPLSK